MYQMYAAGICETFRNATPTHLSASCRVATMHQAPIGLSTIILPEYATLAQLWVQ